MLKSGVIFVCLVVLSSATLTCATTTTPKAQDARVHAQLQKSVEDYELHANNLLEALSQISAHFELPMGVEWAANTDTTKRIHKHFSQGRVQSVLDAAVAEYADYKWELDRGVIHVFPQWANDSHSFLHLRITEFSEKDSFVLFASRDLQRRVNQIVVPVLAYQGRAGSMASGLGDKKVTLELKNGTVEEILDVFLSVADFKLWVITYTGKNDLTSTGFRKTRSLSGRNIPDESQPVWDLLRWDQAAQISDDTAGR